MRQGPQIERDLLITGYPRSGTGYMAKLMQACGLDVGHEQMGENGISDYRLACPYADGGPLDHTQWKPWQVQFRYVIHLVRNPIDVFTSMIFSVLPSGNGNLVWMAKQCGLPQPEHGVWTLARTWLAWNEFVEGQERVRIEDAESVVPALLRRWGFEVPDDEEIAFPSPNENRILDVPSLSWEDYRRMLPLELFRRVREKAKEYGYCES